MNAPDIVFPKIGIEIANINSVAFSIFGLDVYWYGIIICSGILAGLFVATQVAKKTNQDTEIYSEFLIYALISAIIGARIYYVVFSWEQYKDNLSSIFALRQGGLAIYGGVIGAILAAIVYTKVKKINTWQLMDTVLTGLLIGQAIGRWGNFMNMEAFGGYTDNIFAMCIKASKAKFIPKSLENKKVLIDGVEYLQVHPTFLYESLWNIGVLIILLFYYKHKKFEGEIFFLYLLGYGLGRVWIEGLRTDQLIINSLGVPASQLLAGVLIIVSLAIIIYKRIKIKKKKGIGIKL